MIGANILKKRSARAIDSVCRVEIAGNPKGTGFLVGPDMVLTNYHVVEKALNGKDLVVPVGCRFDFAEHELGGVEPGFVVAVKSPVLDFSRYGKAESTADPFNPLPEMDELDYALLQLADAVGNKPAPGAYSKRGWITLRSAVQNVVKDAPLFIVQHPLTAPKIVANNIKSIISLNVPKNRLLYLTEAHPGSSGSPCLTAEWEIIALHHYGDPAWVLTGKRQGIPIWLIHDRIVKGGLESSVPAYRDDVNLVNGFLQALGGAPRDGEIDAKIAKWRDAIIKARDGVTRLKAFKGLHDFLHQCQKLLPLMMLAIRSTDKATAGASLVQYRRILTRDLAKSRAHAAKLQPEGRGERDDQLAWIARLERAARALGAVGMNTASALGPFVHIRDEIRLQLPDINRQLVSEAADLPLDDVIAAFHDFATSKAVAGEGPSAEGPSALERLRDGLRGRVHEHDRWQKVESRLWYLDDAITLDVGLSRQIAVATWDPTWEAIEALCAQDWQSDWARTMIASGTAFARILATEDLSTVTTLFGEFREQTIDRFSDVDTGLLEQCDEIVKIGDPLAALVGAPQ